MRGAAAQLGSYIEAFRRRLGRVALARGAAVVAALCLGVTWLGAYFAIRSGFATEIVTSTRLALLLLVTAGSLGTLILPARRLARGIASAIERRTPAFAGRVATYLGPGQPPNPLAELLAENTLEVARHFPVDRQVKGAEIAVPALLGAAALGALLWLAAAGPGLMSHAVRHIWAGWAIPGLLPPQTIVVTPGDETLRRGGNLGIRAELAGFDPARATLHLQVAGGAWQEIDMARESAGFEFTLFSVREPLRYFVSAAGIRTPDFDVHVVDLPEVEAFRLTLTYPEWTRRPAETIEPGGDIRTIAGTTVALELVTDSPLPAGVLVLNGEPQPLVGDGPTARGEFAVTADGQYFIASVVGGEQIRMTDEFFIALLDDRKPDVRLARPGRDWSASGIEEVTVEVHARDDFALESLELRYAVNGEGWQSLELPIDGPISRPSHVFALEALGASDSTPEDASPMQPGDLIAYYAVAADRDQLAQTDIYFIEVQPFERRYRQSQQMGAGGDQGQQEISRRQKQIIVSTWNLIREQGEDQSSDRRRIADNATLLSELQTTLAEQTATLVRRTRARRLVAADEQIERFVDNMERAAAAMSPAAEQLAAVNLERAIEPEQQALKYLLRAEAAFNDIQVGFQSNAMNEEFGAGRDLADMFELEMDLEKNQYETGNFASPDSESEELNEAMRQLEELARRQERLSNDLVRQNSSPAQRWQQEMLRREAEELRRRIGEMQRRAAAPASASGQSSDSGEDELERRLDSAIRAMREASGATDDREGTASDPQRAAREAGRQLAGALAEARQQELRAIQNRFAELAREARHLYEEQLRVEQELQRAVREASAAGERADPMSAGLAPEREAALAQTKRKMVEDLQQLERGMQDTRRRYRESAPAAAQAIDDAARTMREAEIETSLALAAEYLAEGASAYVAGSESAVTRALRDLRDALDRAETLAGDAAPPPESNLERALARTQALRRGLQAITSGPSPPSQIDRDLAETTDAIRATMPELRSLGLDPREIDEMRELLRQLDLAQFSGNRELLAREAAATLRLVEQLELRLSGAAADRSTPVVRGAIAERVPGEFEEAVAEYYRRLSRE